MDIVEALEIVESGGKVTNPTALNNNSYLYKNGDNIYICKIITEYIPYTPGILDILSKDWETVK